MTNRKNIDTDTEDGLKNVEVNERFLQIRRQMFGDSNAEFSKKIGENDKIVSAICNKSRSAGQTTILKLLQSMPDIDANWLLLGKGEMLRKNKEQKVSLTSSPQSNVANGDMRIETSAELVYIIAKQQETISKQTLIIEKLLNNN